jgi:hypothetical protein
MTRIEYREAVSSAAELDGRLVPGRKFSYLDDVVIHDPVLATGHGDLDISENRRSPLPQGNADAIGGTPGTEQR